MNLLDQMNNLFHTIDAKDTEKFVSFLDENCELTFGNAPVVAGKAGIYTAIDGFFQSIKALTHNVKEIIIKDDSIISYGRVAYFRHDGNEVIANFCNVFKMKGDLIAKYQIYVDISLLYS